MLRSKNHFSDFRSITYAWTLYPAPPNLLLSATPPISSSTPNWHRVTTFAELVGQENVIAGTDCGLSGRVHPQIAWAKLRALRDDAAIASKKLGS